MIELILTGLGHIFGAIIGAVVMLIKALFANVLLVIANIGFTFLDFIQAMFRRLAGLPMEGKENPDIVQNLINSEIIRNTIIALTILAVCLLFIATFVQLARVEFTEDGAKNSKAPIITQALKAFALFVIVPVTCMLGVFMSNLVLKMVDSATSGGNSKTISGLIFKVGAYDANIIREGNTNGIFPTPYAPQYIGLWIVDCILHGLDSIGNDTNSDFYNAYASVDDNGNLNAKAVAILPAQLTGDRDQMAAQLDDIFASDGEDSRAAANGGFITGGTIIIQGITKINYTSIAAVRYFYNIMEFNFLMVFLAIPFAMKALFHTCFGLVMRIYNVLILFVLSPPLIALMPLDGGNAYKGWRQKFIGNVISAYGTVAGLNLFFQILPLVNEIEFFETNNALTKFTMGFYNSLAQLLFVLVGCYMIQDISKMISGFIGAEDALTSGEGMAKKIAEDAKKTGMAVAGAASLAIGVGGISMVSKFLGGAGKKLGLKSPEAKSRIDNFLDSKKDTKIGRAAQKVHDSIHGTALVSKIDDFKDGKGGKLSKLYKKVSDSPKNLLDSVQQKIADRATNDARQDFANSLEGDQVKAYDAMTKDQKRKFLSGEKVNVNGQDQQLTDFQMAQIQSSAAENMRGKIEDWELYAHRFAQFGKNQGIQLIASSGMGKMMNEITGGMFKIFGGKGVGQLDGVIGDSSDIMEEAVFHHTKRVKAKKQSKNESKMPDAFEAMSAANQKVTDNDLMTANVEQVLAAFGDDIGLKQRTIEDIFSRMSQLKPGSASTEDKQKILDSLKYHGLDGDSYDKISQKLSGDNFDFSNLSVKIEDGKVVAKMGDSELKFDHERMKAAVQQGLNEAKVQIEAGKRQANYDGLINAIQGGISSADKAKAGGKSLKTLNYEMANSATREKSERGDIKAILKILQSKL